MAIEDVGILSLLLKKLCKPNARAPFNVKNLGQVARLYEAIRIPRTSAMLAASQSLGDMQLTRSRATKEEILKKEQEIQANVAQHGTLPIMFFGSKYHYEREVEKFLKESKL
jgi:hypothetical protein